jgi:addiction module RelB/DinJ family antitoxin
MKAKTTSVCFNTDPDVKRRAEELLASFGLNMSAALNMFLRQLVREEALPFRAAMRSVSSERRPVSDYIERETRELPDLRDLIGCIDPDYDYKAARGGRSFD